MRAKLTRILTSLLLAGLALAHDEPLVAQSSSALPDPAQILRSLTPQQQEEIKRRMNGAQSGSSPSRPDDAQNRDPRALELQQSGYPEPTAEQLAQMERERLYLQAGDSVIVEVDFELPPLPLPTAAGGAAGLPANAQGAVPQVPGQPPQAAPKEEEVELLPEEREKLQQLIDSVRARNPYRLTREGGLQLPGFTEIPLAGLTVDQATLRLQSENAFRQLQIRLQRLPLDKLGIEAIKAFGYDIFDQSPSTFAPSTDVPVPADYVVGAGDQLAIQLYGSDSRTMVLAVDRDGAIDFPQLGPIRVAGMRFNDAKSTIEQRVKREMTGVQANVTMSDTRSIRVFVTGDAKRPGSYTLSGLGTVTSALYAAGGVKPIGSLRKIELRRQGRLVKQLDLYDLLLRGDTSGDAPLLPGDVVFVPPVGPTATAYGEVQRPAIYELRGEPSVSQLVALAGGLTSQADASKASLTQIVESRRRIVVPMNLSESAAAGPPLRNGDVLFVARLHPTLDSAVMVQGHVHAERLVAFREGLRLSDVIRSVDELKPNADIHYLMIRREDPKDRHISVFSTDLAQALAAPGSDADTRLAGRDRITVFDLESGRDRIVRPLLDELRLQATFGHPAEVVRVDGRTKVPGEYPLEPGMTVSDLIRAGGGLSDGAFGGEAELSRYSVVDGETRRTDLVKVDLAAAMRGEKQADLVLQPFDSLSVKEVQQWGQQELVTLSGEVRFPGKYSIQRGETLKSVLARAGGVTPYGFPAGSVFTRTELREREQHQLDTLAMRLQSDLATLALQGAAANQAQAGTALAVGQSLLSQVRAAKAVGRLVIDLPRVMSAAEHSSMDLVLRDGDELMVPKMPQEVTVIGEVQNATSHLYRADLSRDDYIALSGGQTRKADGDRIYVVRADGSVIAKGGARWFRAGSSVDIKPGDTVVVPFNTERLPALPFWQAVTEILYHVAISAAAVTRF